MALDESSVDGWAPFPAPCLEESEQRDPIPIQLPPTPSKLCRLKLQQMLESDEFPAPFVAARGSKAKAEDELVPSVLDTAPSVLDLDPDLLDLASQSNEDGLFGDVFATDSELDELLGASDSSGLAAPEDLADDLLGSGVWDGVASGSDLLPVG